MTIENTRDRDPFTHLAGMIATDGGSGYIQDMEVAGQRQIVTSQQLPTDAPWDALAELGFIRGDQVPGDALFTTATLPEGWTREGSDHAMWSYVLDERGIRRVSVFYKAAFYDRSAFARIDNVAATLASELMYADEPVALPAEWDALTDVERSGFVEVLTVGVEAARQSIIAYPQFDDDGRYTRRIARGEQGLALCKAASDV